MAKGTNLEVGKWLTLKGVASFPGPISPNILVLHTEESGTFGIKLDRKTIDALRSELDQLEQGLSGS